MLNITKYNFFIFIYLLPTHIHTLNKQRNLNTEEIHLQRNRVSGLVEKCEIRYKQISFKIVLSLVINFGQPSRNSILPSYLLNKLRRL